MKNFIELVPVEGVGISVVIGHNRDILYQGVLNKPLQFEIEHCEKTNLFWIDNTGDCDIEIKSVAMFEQGHDKLRFLGRFQHKDGRPAWQSHWIHGQGRWSISYEYPVFSWLYKTLQYGWLTKPA